MTTNNINLIGSDIIVGGSVIMLIDVKIEAIIISSTKNGKKIKNAIWYAVFNSLNKKAGMTTFGPSSYGESGGVTFSTSINSVKSCSLVCLSIKSLMGAYALSKASVTVI